MGFALPKRQIAAQHPDSGFGEGVGRGFEERGLRIAAGAMCQDKSVVPLLSRGRCRNPRTPPRHTACTSLLLIR